MLLSEMKSSAKLHREQSIPLSGINDWTPERNGSYGDIAQIEQSRSIATAKLNKPRITEEIAPNSNMKVVTS